MPGTVTASLISLIPSIIFSPCSSVPLCSIQSLVVRAQSCVKAPSNVLELIHGLGLPAHLPMTVLGKSPYFLIFFPLPSSIYCSVRLLGGRKKSTVSISFLLLAPEQSNWGRKERKGSLLTFNYKKVILCFFNLIW